MTKLYYVSFIGTIADKTLIKAKTRNEARQIFASLNNVNLSDYIVTSKSK